MPHHRHNNLIIKCLFAFALNLLFVGKIANGQERTDKITFHYDSIHLGKLDTTIIREARQDVWVVYASYIGNANGAFYLVNKAIPYIPSMLLYLDDSFDSPLQVKDMEIFHDTVYFCGRYGLSYNDTAVIGCFSWRNFPVGDVKIMKVDSLTSFNKMSLYHSVKDGNSVHLALIGHDPSNNLYLADAKIVEDSLELYLEQLAATISSLDDIIATDTSVSISARCFQDTSGIIYHFKTHFLSVAAPFMYSAYDSIHIADIPTNHRLCLGENGYYAFIETDTTVAWGNIFSSTIFHNFVRIPSATAFDIREVHYLPATNTVDILIASIISDYKSSFEGSIVISHLGGTSNVLHYYYYQNLTSFTPQTGLPDHYIASGYDYLVSDHLSICFADFTPTNAGPCAKKPSKASNIKNRKITSCTIYPYNNPSQLKIPSLIMNYPGGLEICLPHCY